MNNKFVIGIIVSLLVGLGLGFTIPHGAAPLKEPVLGASLYETNASHFVNGFYAGQSDQLVVDSSGNLTATGNQTVNGNDTATGFQRAAQFLTYTVGSASTTSSTNPTVLLGAAAAGYITIGTSTPQGTLGQQVNASTTAIDANSQVFVQQTATTTIAGVTCNSTATTTPMITSIFASTTNTSLNGFQVKSLATPVTNPICLYYHVVN